MTSPIAAGNSLSYQTALLGSSVSKWMALMAFEGLLPDGQSLSNNEKTEILSTNDFFRQFPPLFEQKRLTFFNRVWFNHFVLPYCQTIAPEIIKNLVQKGIRDITTFTRPGAPFPRDLVTSKLQELSQYFSILHSALTRVAHATVISGSLTDHVSEELEKTQAKRCSTQRLYTTLLSRGIDLFLDYSEEVKLNHIKNNSWHQKILPYIWIKSTFFYLRLGKRPAVWLTRAKLNKPVQMHQEHIKKMSEVGQALAKPFLVFANTVLLAFFNKIQAHHDLDLLSSAGIPSEPLKTLAKQQIQLLDTATSSSPEKLRQNLASSPFQTVQNTVLDNFVLDRVARQVNGIASVGWDALTEPHLVQDELYNLVYSLNRVFVDCYKEPGVPFTDLQDTHRLVRTHIVAKKIENNLNKIEDALENRLGRWKNWSSAKNYFSEKAKAWLGVPLKEHVHESVMTLASKISEVSMEKMLEFWQLPFNMRYAPHYMFLLPLVHR